MLFAIDPGTLESAYVVMDEKSRKPIEFEKTDNFSVLRRIQSLVDSSYTVAIEMVASYGMPVGAEVFDTCVWIGRFDLAASQMRARIRFVYRKEEKLAICGSPHANDATIRRALADRYAPGEGNYGKGTKKNPGFFYGFSADIWSAFAVGVTYLDKEAGLF